MSTQIYQSAQTSLSTGTQVFSSIPLPGNVLAITYQVARCTTATPSLWPNAGTLIEVDLEVSYDGGATWQGGGGFTANGGIFIGKGGEVANSAARFTFNQSPTHIRGSRIITNGPLVTIETILVN